MKNWKIISLLTAIVICLLLMLFLSIFNIKVVRTSAADVGFSPADNPSKVKTDSTLIKPKNIIVVIADGMGFTHLSLAMMTQQEEGKSSVWHEFEVKGWHDTRSTFGPLTDSGASATAMATGTSTFFDVIGQDQDGKDHANVFELASSRQYNTGIVTDSYIWDATPAAFVAHTISRDNARDILMQIADSELDLIFGELEDVGEEEVPDLETTMGIIEKRFHILDTSLKLPAQTTDLKPIAAIYEEDEIQDLDSEPNLPRLTATALQYLSAREKPFALLVECEEMDSGSHENNSQRVLKGLQALQETLRMILDFSREQGETLVVFTSDHETGGLAAVSDSNYPNLQLVWATNNHTATVVPLFAFGPGAEAFSKVNRNREIGILLKSMVQ